MWIDQERKFTNIKFQFDDTNIPRLAIAENIQEKICTLIHQVMTKDSVNVVHVEGKKRKRNVLD